MVATRLIGQEYALKNPACTEPEEATENWEVDGQAKIRIEQVHVMDRIIQDHKNIPNHADLRVVAGMDQNHNCEDQ